MTAIVGIARGGHVRIGGDSGVCYSDSMIGTCKEPKVFRRGSYLVGVAGDANVDAPFRYSVNWPDPTPPVQRLVAVEVAAAVRKALTDAGAGEADFEALIGVRGRLFVLGTCYEVTEPRCRYAAAGDGSAWVQGAVHALVQDRNLTLAQIAEEALKAAAAHCSSVRPPFAYVSI